MPVIISILLYLMMHSCDVTCSGCQGDRNKDHRLRVSCVNQGLTVLPGGIDPLTQVLVLTENRFSSVSWSDYSAFTHLHELDLSHNEITELEPPGPVLENLSVLRLSGNRLTGLGGGVFRCAPSLMEIYLDGNQIRSLHDGTFSDLQLLEVIHLSGNKLPALPSRLLERISSQGLKTFDLENNSISLMPDSFFSSKPELPYVYLSHNLWLCSCSVGYLHSYLNDQDHAIYRHDGPNDIVPGADTVLCAGPAHLAGRPIIDLKEDEFCPPEPTFPHLLYPSGDLDFRAPDTIIPTSEECTTPSAEPLTARPEPSHTEPLIGRPEPSHAEPLTARPEPSHTEPLIGRPEPSHTEPLTGRPEPSHTEPLTARPEPSHAEPLTGRPEPSHAEPLTGRPEPSHAEPLTARPEPSHAEPLTGRPEPSHTEPLTARPEPSHTEPLTARPEPSHTEPLTARPEPSHTEPLTARPEPSHTEPLTARPEPSHTEPLTARPEPSHTEPLTARPEPSHTEPLTARPEPSHTEPLTARPEPSHTEPLTARPEPSHTEPLTARPEPSHTEPLTARPEPSHTEPLTGRPEPSHAEPLTGRPEPSHAEPLTARPEPSHTEPLTGRPEPSHAEPLTGRPEPSHTEPLTGRAQTQYSTGSITAQPKQQATSMGPRWAEGGRAADGKLLPWCWWLFAGFVLLCVLSALTSCFLFLWLLKNCLVLRHRLQRYTASLSDSNGVALRAYRCAENTEQRVLENSEETVRFVALEQIRDMQAVFRSVLYISKEGDNERLRERGASARVELVSVSERAEDGENVTFRKTLHRLITDDQQHNRWTEGDQHCFNNTQRATTRYSLVLRETAENMEWVMGEWEMGESGVWSVRNPAL